MTCSVSVIMPVYNSRNYLKDAVDSILREKSRDFELLLVDDGSTDGSSVLCDEIEKQDNRVRVVHKKNGGMCQARNIGIQQARGKWIAFADNDDKVLPGFITDNLEIAKKYDCDCLTFGRKWIQVGESNRIQFSIEESPETEKCYYGQNVLKNYFECNSVSDGVWVRFYKRTFIINNNIKFDESFRSGFEDSMFNDMVIKHADSYAFNPKCYYVWYRRNSHSTSMKISKNRLSSMEKTLSYEFHLLEDAELLDKEPKQCGELFFSRIFDVLVSNHLASKCSYNAQREIYEAMHEIAAPYERLLNSAPLHFHLQLAKSLLLSKNYPLLYIYLSLGTKAKTVFCLQ